MKVFGRINTTLFNLPGWHTNRKLVVFESDDWGGIRIPSKGIYNFLTENGYSINKSPYGKDSLESNDDISILLNTLLKHENKRGDFPVFTLNFIVANPDFEKIEKENFTQYYFEPFNATYRRYGASNKSMSLLQEGAERGIIRSQLHGREHINVSRWLRALRENKYETLELFRHKMCSMPISLTRESRKDYQRALDYDNVEEALLRCDIINNACDIFEKIWGYRSESFIAPNYMWDDMVEECLSMNDVGILQGQRAQIITNLNGPNKVRYHYTGQRNRYNQLYLIRNCFFEPALDQNKDWVGNCLKGINSAFYWRKPAIIGTHRVNYIGTIDESNRSQNIKLLQSLLKSIINNWPDVEFMSSDKLGRYILNDLTDVNSK